MINEWDAIERAQIDGKRTFRFIENGAHLNRIQRHIISTILHQVKTVASPSALRMCARAANELKQASTLSEQIATRALTIFETGLQCLTPEDCRALAIYLCGIPPKFPGYLTHALDLIGESSAERAMKIVHARINASVTRLNNRDNALFGVEIKKLEMSKQRLINGKILSARWDFDAGDGVNSRMCVQQARTMALAWLRELEEAKRVSADRDD